MNTLAIVGAGAAGVATFIAAVRAQVARSIYMIDPQPIGPGAAFSNTDNDILCNTSVDTMSVLHDMPLDFLEHLRCEGYAFTAESFVPRFLVGRHTYRQLPGLFSTTRASSRTTILKQACWP